MGRPAQLQTDAIQTLQGARDFIAASKGIAMTLAAMHYYFKALGIKKKTGCPSSVRKDEKEKAIFKKKSFPH